MQLSSLSGFCFEFNRAFSVALAPRDGRPTDANGKRLTVPKVLIYGSETTSSRVVEKRAYKSTVNVAPLN
ncbi:hypothetical protein N7470_010180 [Penicillium chermesinum]|nr:hypothetical protein N7470_010180 [Penicillium chermesinum]